LATTSLPTGKTVRRAVLQRKVSVLNAPVKTFEPPTRTREAPSTNRSFQKYISGRINPARVPSKFVPTPAGSPLSLGSSNLGFDALNDVDQGFASGFIFEPPDQGLTVGSGLVLEAVNDAFAFFDASSGADLFGQTDVGGVLVNNAVDLAFFSSLLGLDVRPTDPRCYYEASTGHWFISFLGLGATRNYLVIAVSFANDPIDYYLYALDITDDGTDGTPSHTGCPCFGDQPLIGADQYGFYVSTNEFYNTLDGFNGAQVYAFDKAAMEAGSSPNVIQFSLGALEEGIAYSVVPANVPPGGSFDTNNGGTEYFLSSMDFFGTLDNRIAAWAMTGSSNLPTNPNLLAMHEVTLGSEIYGTPPDNQQPAGPLPLVNYLLANYGIKEKEELLASNDDRMQQVVFANGSLWSSLETVVKTGNGPTRTGAAYFVVTPNFPDAGSFTPSISKQGYISVLNQSMLFPAVGVNASGQGVVSFSVVGPNIYPSAGWAKLDASGAGSPKIAAVDALPDDGFSGYSAFGGNRVGRWGDYSGAVSDEAGNIWVATEYIPNRARFTYANWGTFISSVTP
jgi:hypothetical protein